jgi:hypothetical protein
VGVSNTETVVWQTPGKVFLPHTRNKALAPLLADNAPDPVLDISQLPRKCAAAQVALVWR